MHHSIWHCECRAWPNGRGVISPFIVNRHYIQKSRSFLVCSLTVAHFNCLINVEIVVSKNIPSPLPVCAATITSISSLSPCSDDHWTVWHMNGLPNLSIPLSWCVWTGFTWFEFLLIVANFLKLWQIVWYDERSIHRRQKKRFELVWLLRKLLRSLNSLCRTITGFSTVAHIYKRGRSCLWISRL